MLKFIAAIFLCGIALGASAQQSAPTPTRPKSANPKATVLFTRSDSQTSDPTTDQPTQTATPSAAPHASSSATASKITDAQRAAVTFNSYRLDVHLAPRDHHIAVRAQIQLRNDGSTPLYLLPLQLSSSLNFESVSLDGKPLPFTQQTLNSDADHTGQLHEASVSLPTPLVPKATLSLVIVYSGDVALNARRLVVLGTPDDTADHSDWDRISEDFTGLRGFGNVVWYPVASVPALLGDGDRLFAEISSQKVRQSAATVAIRLTIEYYLASPSVIALDGHSIPVPKPSVTPTQNYPGVLTCSLPATRLGFATPSLFLADWPPNVSDGLSIYARPEDQPNVQNIIKAAKLVQPVVEQWLGPNQKSPVTIIDLPEPEDLAWEQGPLLLYAVTSRSTDDSAAMLTRALAHAWFQSPREWLDEGVPTFIETLWTEHTDSRTRALEQLESQRGALALAEPASPGDSTGEPLLQASDPIYYRTKAAYVLWMLRDLTGDKELADALTAYNPADDTAPGYFEKLVEQSSGKNLPWFFDNWVYNDRGLPDLTISAFHSTTSSHPGLYLAAIDVMNDGYAETEVPVTVRSGTNTLTERVLLPAKTRTVHRMLVQGQPDEVIVNDGTVPEVSADIHQRNITDQ